jgi:cysteine desulfuration protein SufE
MTTLPTIDQIKSDFDLLEDWEDRYRYVIELGRQLPPLPETARTEANKVRGCASQVWLASKGANDGDHPLDFAGASDSHIVQGLIAILLAQIGGKTARQILALDISDRFAELGLKEHLTPQRSNGLASMINRVRADARAIAGPA